MTDDKSTAMTASHRKVEQGTNKDWRFYAAWLTRKIWMSAAILLVTLAVLISLVRYSLPYMDSQKHHLEQLLKEKYNSDIKIGYISAIWKGKGPAIVLKDVVLSKDDDSPLSFSIDETQIELDFWASVQQQQIQSQRFNLIGMQLEVDLPRIEGGGEQFPILDALQTLFLEQLARFSVSNSEVLLRTRLDEQKIQIQQLSWLNKEQRHQGVGQLRVAELARNSARFVLDLSGSKDSFNGTFYAEAEDLDLTPWIKALVPTEYEIKRSRGNFELWAGLENTRVTYVQANIAESQFVWQGEQSENQVLAELMKGRFYAIPNNNGWDFNFDDFSLIVNDRVFSSAWQGSVFTNRVLTLQSLEPLNLAPLLPLTSVLMGEAVQEQLTAFGPQLSVDKAQFYLSDEHVGAHLAFSDFSLKEQQSIPGVNALQGEIFWLNKQGRIALSSQHNYLASSTLLGFVVPYDELTIAANINLDENQIQVPQLILKNNDLTLSQSIEYNLETGSLTALADLSDIELPVLKQYLPELMGNETRSWLNRALVSGATSGGKVLWQGRPADFPFEQGQGIFQAALDIEQLELKFQRDWPALEKANVNLLFENMGLTIKGTEGEISGVQLQEAVAVIPELREQSYVQIDAIGAGTGKQLTNLFQNSSLQNSVGSALDFLKVNGDLAADLSLHIPLVGENIKADARVQFADNRIEIPALDMTLDTVSGTLVVANENLVTENLTASLLGQPLALEARTQQKEAGYATDVSFQGNWDLHNLVQPHHPQLAKYLEGATDWKGSLNLLLPEQGYQYSLQIQSMLEGVELIGPDLLAKSADSALSVFLDSEGDQQASTVRMLLGRDVKFNGILPHDTMQFSRAHLSAGGDNFVGMGLGFSVSADLPTLNYADWHKFIGDMVDGLPSDGNAFISAPQRVFIEAQQLMLAGQQFNNAEILAKNRDTFWELEVASEQARADVKLHKNWLQDGVEVQADYINLAHWQETDGPEKRLDHDYIPPITLSCRQCSFKNIELGQVKASMVRSATGMKIDTLEIAGRDGTLVANGDWYFNGNEDSTRLTGRFDSEDFGSFLKGLDFDSGIRDSDARMAFDLSWQEAPYAFSAEDLNGQLNFRLGDGYITEISDKGARLLSIFSLESLLRKLTLDFRDVFAKGFFYDDLQGTFTIADGLVKTDDTHIDGAAAGVDIKGYANLTDNQINYIVDVKPNITSSLPVLVAWMVNPATAVAALAFDEVFTSANVVAGIQYSLTGSIKEPQVTLLEQTNKVVELPAKANPKRGNSQQQPGEPATPQDSESPQIDGPVPGDELQDNSETESGE